MATVWSVEYEVNEGKEQMMIDILNSGVGHPEQAPPSLHWYSLQAEKEDRFFVGIDVFESKGQMETYQKWAHQNFGKGEGYTSSLSSISLEVIKDKIEIPKADIKHGLRTVFPVQQAKVNDLKAFITENVLTKISEGNAVASWYAVISADASTPTRNVTLLAFFESSGAQAEYTRGKAYQALKSLPSEFLAGEADEKIFKVLKFKHSN